MIPSRTALGVVAAGGIACARSFGTVADGGPEPTFVAPPTAVVQGAPRAGMRWIPAGQLRAGSAVEDVPRVAAAELPGIGVALDDYYIDVLPWPNEAAAIPTTNVTRDEAERLCASKGKRLCSELEWERACKGPDNLRYEYGPSYDPQTCGAGAPEDDSARRPSGGHFACQSGFGVRDMHGAAWEWTSSRWGRGATRDLGVIRGGNDATGDLVTRCAYARSSDPTARSPATGFRCCAGARNEAEVHLDVRKGPVVERTAGGPPRVAPALAALGGASCGPPMAPSPCRLSRSWTWRPEANVELSVSGGCVGRGPTARCAVGISRADDEQARVLTEVDTGHETPDVVYVSAVDQRIRLRCSDPHGRFACDVAFLFGRLEVHDVR